MKKYIQTVEKRKNTLFGEPEITSVFSVFPGLFYTVLTETAEEYSNFGFFDQLIIP